MMNEDFDEAFLAWFRAKMETTWATYRTTPFKQYKKSGVGGSDWQRGTRWLGGMTEEEIEQCEQRFALTFPPDYRLFLKNLHCVNLPKKGARYSDVDERGDSYLVPTEAPSFPDWFHQESFVQTLLNRPLEGLLFNVENNHYWLPGWGVKPSTFAAQKEVVSRLFSQASKLIPVVGNRYLVGQPQQVGNPVLSVHQSDIIIYGHNLLDFFLREFSDLLDIPTRPYIPPGEREWAILREYNPFWYEIAAADDFSAI